MTFFIRLQRTTSETENEFRRERENIIWVALGTRGKTRRCVSAFRMARNGVTVERAMCDWFLVFWLFILSAVSYLDRVNISIAGGSIAEAYHLSDVQLGKVFSAMLVGYALFQTIGGKAGGPLRTAPGAGRGRGVVGNLHGPDCAGPGEYCRRTFDALYASAFFWAQARRSFIPPPISSLRAGFRPRNAALRMDGFSPEWERAPALRRLIITYIMIHYGWRSSFWVCSIIGFAAGAVWFVSGSRHTRRASLACLPLSWR